MQHDIHSFKSDIDTGIVFIRPGYHTHIITPPLGILSLAAVLRKHGFRVAFIDALRDNLTESEIADRADRYHLIGLTDMSAHHIETMSLARRFKSLGRKVVIGGPHASALPRETQRDTAADAVFIGESEETLLHWMNMPTGDPPVDGVFTDKSSNPFFPSPPDPDTLPEPAWDLAPPNSYPIAPHGAFAKRTPTAPMMTSRGCAFRCTFCTAPFLHQRRVRFRNPSLVLDEIERLVRDFGVKEIHFEDNNITARPDHMTAIAQGLIDRRIDITWSCPNGVRTENLSVELLRLMKRSGCHLLAFGLESGTQSILDGIHKDTSLKSMLEAVARTSDAGIRTQGFFIIGLPRETRETLEATIETARESRLDRAQFHLLDVLPGSDLWDTIGTERIGGFERRGFQEPVWIPPGLTEKELLQAQRRAFRRFYLRPRILRSLLKDWNWRQFFFFWRRIQDFGLLRRL